MEEDFFEIDFDKFKEEYEEENEIKEDDFGFSEVLKERQKKKDALRERLKKYYLTDKEIDELFKIIQKAEDKMEKIKKSVNYKTCEFGETIQMQNRLIATQNQMKNDFDTALSKLLKKKYEDAKKILEKREKNSNS